MYKSNKCINKITLYYFQVTILYYILHRIISSKINHFTIIKINCDYLWTEFGSESNFVIKQTLYRNAIRAITYLQLVTASLFRFRQNTRQFNKHYVNSNFRFWINFGASTSNNTANWWNLISTFAVRFPTEICQLWCPKKERKKGFHCSIAQRITNALIADESILRRI